MSLKERERGRVKKTKVKGVGRPEGTRERRRRRRRVKTEKTSMIWILFKSMFQEEDDTVATINEPCSFVTSDFVEVEV